MTIMTNERGIVSY